jgi:hypothetical protein
VTDDSAGGGGTVTIDLLTGLAAPESFGLTVTEQGGWAAGVQAGLVFRIVGFTDTALPCADCTAQQQAVDEALDLFDYVCDALYRQATSVVAEVGDALDAYSIARGDLSAATTARDDAPSTARIARSRNATDSPISRPCTMARRGTGRPAQ